MLPCLLQITYNNKTERINKKQTTPLVISRESLKCTAISTSSTSSSSSNININISKSSNRNECCKYIKNNKYIEGILLGLGYVQ
jgi:hypothetical protein